MKTKKLKKMEMFTVKNKCNHQWKFVYTAWIPLDGETIKADRYSCRLCERVYYVNNATGERLHLHGRAGEEI